MRNKNTKALTAFLISLLVIVLCSFLVSADDGKYAEWDISANSSDSVKATLYFDAVDGELHKLVISGNGEMKDFSNLNAAPWLKDYALEIATVEIESGVENIGAHAFVGCTALSRLTVHGLYTEIPMSLEEEVSHGVCIVAHPNSTAGILAEQYYTALYELICTFEDGVCTVCSYACTEHRGGTPTCEKPGACEICGTEYGFSKGHNPRTVAKKSATCTDDGINEHKYCEDCGTYFNKKGEKTDKESLLIKASHSYGDLILAKASSCADGGNEAYYLCSVCNEYFDEQKNKITTPFLPATEQHSGGKATCSTPAICQTCNSEYGETDPTVHSFSDKYAYGSEKHWRYCTCGEKVDYANHVFAEEILTVPSLTEEGRTKKSCYCGYSYIEILPMLQPDEPLPNPEQTPPNTENQDSTGMPIWTICLISVGGLALIISAVLIIRKKRQGVKN